MLRRRRTDQVREICYPLHGLAGSVGLSPRTYNQNIVGMFDFLARLLYHDCSHYYLHTAYFPFFLLFL